MSAAATPFAADRPRQLCSAEVLAGSLAAGIPLAVLLWLSGAVSLPLALAAMLALALVILGCGLLLVRATGTEGSLAAAWVAGVVCSALAVYALVRVLGVLADTAFVIWAILVAAANVVLHRRGRQERRVDAQDVIGLLLCGALTVMWCRDIAAAPEALARERLLPAWIDYFIHAGVISSFGDPLAAGQGSVDLAGYPARFYHFASYVLPAALARPLDLPGLPLATSAWLPLGFLTLCTGGYAFGARVAGPAGGVAALAALALLPDASNIGLRNGFFSFHWNVLAVPGATYATGAALLAFAMLGRGRDGPPLRALAAGAALAAATLLLRVHIFLLAFPAWLASAVAASAIFRARRLLVASLGMAAFVAFVLAFYRLQPDAAPALQLFVDNVHALQEPTAYPGLYRSLLARHGAAVAVPIGMVLVLVAALGPFAILYPAVALLTWRARGLQAADLVPLSLIACYVLLMLTAPVSQHGDSTELTQRPFVVLYAGVSAWTLAATVGWLAARHTVLARRAWHGLLLAAGLAMPLAWHQTVALALPKFHWGWQHVGRRVPEGMPQAAAFVRGAARAGDVFAVQGLKLGWVASDGATQFSALTGMPAYLARPFVHTMGGPRETEALDRYASLVAVAGAPSAGAALRRLGEQHIAWYVVIGSQGPGWDPERRQAAFAEGSVAVYSVRMKEAR